MAEELTDFGDAAVLLPLAGLMLVWLMRSGSPHLARSWIVAVGLCGAVTAALKIYLYRCSPSPQLVSPSGHTALSALVYGSIALVVAAQSMRRWVHVAVGGFAVCLITAIAISRVLLNQHRIMEIAVGAAVGAGALVLFGRRYLRFHAEGMTLRPLILSAVVVIAVLHGQELRAEGWLHAISRYLNITGTGCLL